MAMLLTLILEALGSRRKSFKTELNVEAVPKIKAFLEALANDLKWSQESKKRLYLAGEETLLALLDDRKEGIHNRHLLLMAKKCGSGIELEFLAATTSKNMENQLAILSEQPDGPAGEQEVSLRLIKHATSSLRHQQYHSTDIVTMRIDPIS